jgi:hypothetical protein
MRRRICGAIIPDFFSHGGTKTRGLRIKVAIDGSSDAVTHERFAKVQQVAQLETG